jgi:cysteine-rich repeat protein
MKFIYAVCLLVLLPATASAAEPKWSFRKEGVRGAASDEASVSWPNPQYRGTLSISVRCHKPGSDGLLMNINTGEELGGGIRTVPLLMLVDGKRTSVDAMVLDSSLMPLRYGDKVGFIDGILAPSLTITVTDTDQRPVVTTPVPASGAEAALRKLSCLSRYFYEFEQRPKAEPEPEAPVVPAAPAAPANRCGDGFIQEGEICDDSNAANDDGCSADCTVQKWPSMCGDGVQQAGEGCDDGNHLSNDTCEPDCTLPLRNGGVRP